MKTTEVTLQDKVNDLAGALKAEVFEMEEVIDGLMLALASGTHIFLHGIPGIAKSFVGRRLVGRIENLRYFPTDFNPYTIPSDLFGPDDLKALRERGERTRRSEGYLPWADIWFGDEIWRAGQAVLASTLLAMNEREYKDNGKNKRMNLSTGIFASNSFPDDVSLDAAYDRIHQRFWVRELQERDSFVAMLLADLQPMTPVMTWGHVELVKQEVVQVKVPVDVAEAVWDVRSELRDAHNISPSPRRYNQSVDILRAEAWRQGRDKVLIEDMEVLGHVLPENPDQQAAVDRVLVARCNPKHDAVLKLINGEVINGALVGGWAQLADMVDSALAMPEDNTTARGMRAQKTTELTMKLQEAMKELKVVLAEPMSSKTHASAMKGKRMLVSTFYRCFEGLHHLNRDMVAAQLASLGVGDEK